MLVSLTDLAGHGLGATGDVAALAAVAFAFAFAFESTH